MRHDDSDLRLELARAEETADDYANEAKALRAENARLREELTAQIERTNQSDAETEYQKAYGARMLLRADRAEASLAEALEALRKLGTEHGCEPGSSSEEDKLVMCSVCRKALAICDKHPEGTRGDPFEDKSEIPGPSFLAREGTKGAGK